MKILYFDCSMGAAGDMLAGSLLELFPNREQVLAELNALGIPHVKFMAEKSVKCGITGTHLRVLVDGKEEGHSNHHHHTGLIDITHTVEHLQVSPSVRSRILDIYQIIANAESHVHNEPVEHIHFHEVGAIDAIADVTVVCYLLEQLNVDQVFASPVHVGSGQVACEHGVLPVPAPATAYILQGVPIYGGQIQGELCTPTGAALLKYFISQFGAMPAMTAHAIGYGMGSKGFSAPNCVRAMLGTAGGESDCVAELCCNLDDMTGEAIGFATEQLLCAGALDVFTTPIYMKKSRPAVLLTVLCRVEDKDTFVRLLFRHTTTLGIRENKSHRYTLTRRTETVQTAYGPVRQKIAEGYGITRSKYEYEDLSRIAKENDFTLNEVL